MTTYVIKIDEEDISEETNYNPIAVVDTETSLLLGTSEKLIHTEKLWVRQPDGKEPIYWIEQIYIEAAGIAAYTGPRNSRHLSKLEAAIWLINNNIPLTDELEKELERYKI